MQQNTEGMVDNLILVLLEIYLSLQQWKNFANPPRIDKVIAMIMVAPFFLTHGVYCNNWPISFVNLYLSWLSVIALSISVVVLPHFSYYGRPM